MPPALRAAIAANAGFPATPDQVLVSTGAKQALFNLFQATLNPGDEVIIPAPYWSSYRDIVGICGGRVIELPCGPEDGFKLRPERLAAAITGQTRWLLLNSPNNPSGAMYSRAEIGALGAVLRDHPHVAVATDEIYQHIAYAPFTAMRVALPDLADRIATINGVSKAYAMTGWRIGWTIAPKPLIDAMAAVQGQSTSGACSIAQAAALAALTGDQSLLVERAERFRSRRDRVVKALNAMPHLSCPVPDGAFYVFPSCQDAIGRTTAEGSVIADDVAFCAHVLASEGLALVPGSAFGMAGHFRLSYAYGDADLTDGLARLARALSALG
jgi:aspartate aminotransferase